MGETINHNSEALETVPHETEWDKLASVPFGDRAEQETSATETPSAATTGLQVMENTTEQPKETYRPVGEMEKSEIAREYMDLLHSLSDNFTSPEGVNSAVVNPDGSVRDRRGYSGDQEFVKNLYRKNGLELDESNNLEELRNAGQPILGEDLHYENEDLDRAHTLRMVDSILSGEQEWRDAGEEAGEAQSTLTSAMEKLNQLKTEHQSKGFFGRITSALNFRKQVKEVSAMIAKAQEDLSKAERRSQNGNRTLMGSLEAAYSPDYHYGSHQLSYEHRQEQGYQEQVNEDYNNQFFGANDPERQAQINRALELRKALQQEV